MVRIKLPGPLRQFAGNQDSVEVPPGTVRGCLAALIRLHPGVEPRLLKDGETSRFVNIYLGDEDIKFLNKTDTPVPDGSELSIVAAVAGG